MKHWQTKAIVSGIMVAIGVVFVFRFGAVGVGCVWFASAILLAWMK